MGSAVFGFADLLGLHGTGYLLPVIAALVVGLAWPASRKVIAVSTCTLAALALAWFAFYLYSANNTF